MWHINNYEPSGTVNFASSKGSCVHNIMAWHALYNGSMIIIVDDGSRFLVENGMII